MPNGINDLSHAALQTDDTGATYSYGGTSNLQGEGDGELSGGTSRIAYNIIHDIAGSAVAGIFLDNYSNSYLIDHNVVYNVATALKLNQPSLNNFVYNNTLDGLTYSINAGGSPTGKNGSFPTVVQYNLLFPAPQSPQANGNMVVIDPTKNTETSARQAVVVRPFNPADPSVKPDYHLIGHIVGAPITDNPYDPLLKKNVTIVVTTGTAPDRGPYEYENVPAGDTANTVSDPHTLFMKPGAALNEFGIIFSLSPFDASGVAWSLSWNPVPYAQGYEVFSGNSADIGSMTLLKSLPSNVASYALEISAPWVPWSGATYQFFAVRAIVSGQILSDPSNSASWGT